MTILTRRNFINLVIKSLAALPFVQIENIKVRGGPITLEEMGLSCQPLKINGDLLVSSDNFILGVITKIDEPNHIVEVQPLDI